MQEEMKVRENSNTFVVKIVQTQNHTWQGSITWVESGKQEYFRSALEMLSLMNQVVDGDTFSKEA